MDTAEHDGDFVFGVRNRDIQLSDEMTKFLQAEDVDIEEIKHRNILHVEEEDDSHPIASYFVSSSHNTYLLAKQLLGQVSVKSYSSVLANGARCVEIDVWPSPNGPIVTHGHTFSDSLPFGEVCLAIGKAVQPDDWPVLVSLECHLDPEEQPNLIWIMKNAWGNKLVSAALENVDPGRVSPRDFRGKILLMIEYYPGEVLHIPSGDGDASGSDYSESEGSQWLFSLRKRRADEGKSKTKVKISNELAALGFYLRSTKPIADDFLIKPITDPALHILVNISEPALKVLAPTRAKELITHAHTHFRRVYPEGIRIDSSNQDPLACWRNGSQVAALNWQTWDRGMQINEAMFSGSKGWVLKPPSLRGAEGILQRHMPHFFKHDEHTLTVEIAGATNLPREGEGHDKEWSLYVHAELTHVDGNQEWDSKGVSVPFTPRANPMWHEKVTWTLPRGDELAFVRLAILRSEWGYDRYLGFFAARLAKLNADGHWHLAKLLDATGKDTSSALLVKFTYE